MYHLIGLEADNDSNVTEPFAKPEKNATITFWQGKPMTLYQACLVQVIDKTDTTIDVLGVNVCSEEPDTSKVHRFDLRNTELIWPCLPTSNWRQIANDKNYMVLLIQSKLVNDEPTLKAAKAEDGGKWPRGSGEKLFALTEELTTILDRLRELRGQLDDQGQKSLDSLFADYLR